MKSELLKDISNVDIAKCEDCKMVLLTVLYNGKKMFCPYCMSSDITNPYKEIKVKKLNNK